MIDCISKSISFDIFLAYIYLASYVLMYEMKVKWYYVKRANRHDKVPMNVWNRIYYSILYFFLYYTY